MYVDFHAVSSNELLEISCEDLVYSSSQDQFQAGVNYRGECPMLSIEFDPNTSEAIPVRDLNNQYVATIPAEVFATNSGVYFQIVARSNNGSRTICSTSKYYYRLSRRKLLSWWHVRKPRQGATMSNGIPAKHPSIF